MVLCLPCVPGDTQLLMRFTFEVSVTVVLFCFVLGGGVGGGGGITKEAFLSVNNWKFDWSHHELGKRTDTDAVGAASSPYL